MTTTTPAQQIDALSVASEFLLCAIRALAHGSKTDEVEVSEPVAWARAKIEEAMGGASNVEAFDPIVE
jgi:hypothetical protein